MSEPETPLTPFRIGRVRAEPARNVLSLDGVEQAIEPRVMEVLCVLAETPGEVVSRAALIERLWPTQYGADESLTRAISLLRRAGRELGIAEPLIETITKRGYRLLPAVQREATAEASAPLQPEQSPTHEDRAEPAAAVGREAGPTAADRTGIAEGVPARAGDPTGSGGRWGTLTTLSLLAVVGALTALALYWLQTPSVEQATERMPAGLAGSSTSVAVLPLEALSNDASDAYLGRGIAEELLNALARYADLQVIARTSAFASSGADADVRTTGQQLGAEHLIRGSIRRAEGRMRITLQLLRTRDASSLWSATYEFDSAELFTIEDRIVRDIAAALQVRLGVGAFSQRSDGAGVDPLAYEQYLQGLTLWGDRMRRDGNRAGALAAFRRAVGFAPEFADAWAGIGLVGVLSVGSPLSRDRERFRRDTEQALQKALSLDPDNVTAHAGLAHFYATQKIDVPRAQQHLAEAIALAPNTAQTQLATAWVLRALGDADAALAAYDRVIALDPLNLVTRRVRAELLVELGRTDEAMVFFEQCLETACLSEGFVVYGSVAATFHGDAETLARWLRALDAFEARIAGIPDTKKPNVAKIMPAFFSIRLQRADAGAARARVRALYEAGPITDTAGIWAPTFADVLDRDVFMDTLHLAYERGDLFSAPLSFSPLYGVNPYPGWVLRHERYRTLWERPGMPELADAWRRNGRTAGLPQPADSRAGPAD